MAEMISLGQRGQGHIDMHPDKCPMCHSLITPNLIVSRQGGRQYKHGHNELIGCEIVYQCPGKTCDEYFIAYYRPSGDGLFRLVGALPSVPKLPTLPACVVEYSAAFRDIYNEAFQAEVLGLREICGVGYRKALEFLIKDYLIKTRPADEVGIRQKHLGPCIEAYVVDHRIKEITKRAVWLGNDETHYERKWIDKDLKDLKVLLNLVVGFIEAEHLAAEALATMPAPLR